MGDDFWGGLGGISFRVAPDYKNLQVLQNLDKRAKEPEQSNPCSGVNGPRADLLQARHTGRRRDDASLVGRAMGGFAFGCSTGANPIGRVGHGAA
jgi:hypothetical protein